MQTKEYFLNYYWTSKVWVGNLHSHRIFLLNSESILIFLNKFENLEERRDCKIQNRLLCARFCIQRIYRRQAFLSANSRASKLTFLWNLYWILKISKQLKKIQFSIAYFHHHQRNSWGKFKKIEKVGIVFTKWRALFSHANANKCEWTRIMAHDKRNLFC